MLNIELQKKILYIFKQTLDHIEVCNVIILCVCEIHLSVHKKDWERTD